MRVLFGERKLDRIEQSSCGGRSPGRTRSLSCSTRIGTSSITIAVMGTNTKRSWNWALWIGFAFVIVGFLSYIFFISFRSRAIFRGRTSCCLAPVEFFFLPVWSAPSANRRFIGVRSSARSWPCSACWSPASFSYLILYELRQVSASLGAPHVGQKAPEFTLPDQDGKPTALVDLISGSKAVLLIFIADSGDHYATPSCGVSSRGFRSSNRVVFA